MSVYQPTYKDKKTGKLLKSKVWWTHFQYSGQDIRESTKTTRKTLAKDYEENRRRDLEKAFAGVPSAAPSQRIASVQSRIDAYLENYALSHRPKSVIFAKQRLAHVSRLLGSA